MSRHKLKASSASVFKNQRADAIEKANALVYPTLPERAKAAAKTPEPSLSLGPGHVLGDLDAPGGERWFYSGTFSYDSIPPHIENGVEIAYTQLILREYEFTLYDARMQVVGKIKDRVDYRGTESRVPECDLAPVVTRNFFNTDDNYELMVGLALNPGEGLVNYRTYVYSIGGETYKWTDPETRQQKEFDNPVRVLDSWVADVLDGSSDSSENYFMTFMDEVYVDYRFPDDFDWEKGSTEYWEALCSNKLVFNVYSKATSASDGPVKIFTNEIPIIQLPGDQMNAPFLISFKHDGKPCILFQKYQNPYYNPYYTPSDENVTMRSPNYLTVDIYSLSATKATRIQNTRIQFAKDNGDGVLASYFSVGSMRYREDINYTDYNSPAGQAAFIVTKENYKVGNDDSYINSYYVFNKSGNTPYRVLFQNATSTLSLSDIEGKEPQQVFVSLGGDSYLFNFVDLVSAKKVLTLNSQYVIDEDSEPEALTANFDRTPAEGGYKYAFELRVPVVDENENDNARIIWIDSKGGFERIDEVNMGSNVHYASLYIERDALRNDFYHADKEQEYMLLVKRGTDSTGSIEELMIAQAKSEAAPEGRTILHLKPDTRGDLNTIAPIDQNGDRKLFVRYYNRSNSQAHVDFYDLPFNHALSAVTDVEGDASNPILFDGGNVIAAGEHISVYDTSGALVAGGYEKVSISQLPKGVYLVHAGKSTVKIYY